MGIFDGGARSLGFGNTNDQTWLNRWRGGVIVDVRPETQQTDWKTKAPIFADAPHNTKPKMQLPIILKCDGQGPQAIAMGAQGIGDERTDPTDDGRRTLYVKGTLTFDIGNKLRELNADTNNLIGGELYVKMTGYRDTPNGPGRTWEILYFPPPANAQAGSFFAAEQQAPPQAPPAQVPQQPAPQGNPYGFGHQPAASPGGQAFAQAQQPAQAPAAPAGGASPFGAAPAPQQAPQAPAQGSPFGVAPQQAAPAPSNNPFG